MHPRLRLLLVMASAAQSMDAEHSLRIVRASAFSVQRGMLVPGFCGAPHQGKRTRSAESCPRRRAVCGAAGVGMHEQQQGGLPVLDADAAGSCTRRALLRRAGAVAACAVVTSAAKAPASDAARETVLVAGATGRTGVEVTSALIASGFSPLCMVRAGRASKAAVAPGVRTFECDVTDPDASERVADALRKYHVTSIICTLGFVPTFVSADDRRLAQAIDNKGVCAMIKAAESAGLHGRFVLVSSLLASGKTDNLSAQLLNSLGGVVDAKHASETALASSSLDWTILRPGVFAERRQGNLVVGAADRFVGEESDRRLLGAAVSCASPFMASSGAVCGITRQQLADACVRSLGDNGAQRATFELVARPDAPPLARGLLSASVVD